MQKFAEQLRVYETEGDNYGKTPEMLALDTQTDQVRKSIAAAQEKVTRAGDRVKVCVCLFVCVCFVCGVCVCVCVCVRIRSCMGKKCLHALI